MISALINPTLKRWAIVAYPSGTRHLSIVYLRQHRLVEFFPIIQVIQIHGIFRGSAVIRQGIRAENRFARRVIVDVATNRGVEFLDGSLVQLGRILFYPSL